MIELLHDHYGTFIPENLNLIWVRFYFDERRRQLNLLQFRKWAIFFYNLIIEIQT